MKKLFIPLLALFVAVMCHILVIGSITLVVGLIIKYLFF